MPTHEVGPPGAGLSDYYVRGVVQSLCAVTVAGQELLASAGFDGTVKIWDPATGRQHTVLEGHQGRVWSVCPVRAAGQDLLASADGDGTVRIWDPATGRQRNILEGHQGRVNAVCPVQVAGQELLASAGDDHTVRIWDPTTAEVWALMRVEGPLHACAQIDAKGLAAGGHGGLYVFDLLLDYTPGPPKRGTDTADAAPNKHILAGPTHRE